MYTELAILDELGKVQGVRDPYSEAEQLEPVWLAQRAARDALQSARDALVGARVRVAARTGWSAERRAEVKRQMEAENISEKSPTDVTDWFVMPYEIGSCSDRSP